MKSHIMRTRKEKEAMDKAIHKNIAKHMDRLDKEIYTLVASNLHEQLGFGEKRITDFLIGMDKGFEELIDRYQMPDDVPWLCDHFLRESGIDMDKIYAEVKKRNGL